VHQYVDAVMMAADGSSQIQYVLILPKIAGKAFGRRAGRGDSLAGCEQLVLVTTDKAEGRSFGSESSRDGCANTAAGACDDR
jgi:hypothetical protein